MKTLTSFSVIKRVVPVAFACLAVAAAQASTIWNGPNIGFYSPGNGATDEITTNVIIARGTDGGGLYNSAPGEETGATAGVSPKGTSWAVGTLTTFTNNPGSLSFGACPLEEGNRPPRDVNTTYVVHLLTNDIYLQFTLTNWGGAGGNGSKTFGYTRSTAPAIVASPPTLAITNPVTGAVFAAPASVTIHAAVTNGSSAVTNVQFYSGNIPLGSAPAAPFNFTANNLGAGSDSLTAVATAGGITATSPAVNINVVTPVTVSLSNSAVMASTNFQFSYAANVGLSYVVQISTNLSGVWVSLMTNVAASNPVVFVDPQATNNSAFYRVGLLPNP
ncbi:MAG: Ig-like domain-containing protein [Limisphaerales bacterium]